MTDDITSLIRTVIQIERDEEVNASMNKIVENFREVVYDPSFYTITFDKMLMIVKKIDFKQIDDSVSLLKEFIKRVNKAYERDSVFLLNCIQRDNLPPMTLDDIVEIVSKFKNCGLLSILGDIHEGDKKALMPDYEYEVETRDAKIIELQNQVKKLKAKMKFNMNHLLGIKDGEDQSTNKFPPVTKNLEGLENYCRLRFGEKGEIGKHGKTPLHKACHWGFLPSVQYLCEIRKEDVEAKDDNGRTPLFYACLNNKITIVRYLCEAQHAQMLVYDKSGQTPYSISGETIQKYFKRKGITA